MDLQLTSANHKEEIAEAKAENVTLQKTICRLNSTNEKKILYLYDFIAFLGDSVASGVLSKPLKQKLKRCKLRAKLIKSKSCTVGEQNNLEDVDESSVLDVDETQGPFSCASSVDMGLGSSVCTSDDEKYPSTATTPTRDSCLSPSPQSFAFTLPTPTSPKLTYLPKQYSDASTSPLKIKNTTVGCDPICFKRKIMKVNVATSPIKELQIDYLNPASPKDDIEDSTVRDILSKTSHSFKIISPIPFNEAMDSTPVDSLSVAEIVVEPTMKTKDKHPENILKIKKKKKFDSLISYLSVMTKSMIKEELKKMNPITPTPAEKSDSEKNDLIKETKNKENQVIVLNNSNSTESSQLTLPNQPGYIIINTAPGTVYHMASPAPSSKQDASNSTPGSSKHTIHNANTEFSDICTKHSRQVQKPRYTPTHFPPASHISKEKMKSSKKFISKDLFESDDDVMNDQQSRQLRTSPRTSLSNDEDRCSSVEPERFHKHSEYCRVKKSNLKGDKQSSRSRSLRMSSSDSKKNNSSDLERVHNYSNSGTPRYEKNNLKNGQPSCKPHDEVNETASKYIDSKIQQYENSKNDNKNRRTRQSPRTNFSDKKVQRNEEIKKTLLDESVYSDSDTYRSDKNNLNIDQPTCRSRSKPNIVLPDERDHINENNAAVTVEKVNKYSVKKPVSNKEHKTSTAKQSSKSSLSDKNNYLDNRENISSELQRAGKCFDSELCRTIYHTQVNDKQSCDMRIFSDTEDHHFSENGDPVEVENNIHKSKKNKRKFSESLDPFSEIKTPKEMSCKSNIKSGQLGSSSENQYNSCVEFVPTNTNVIDVPCKESLSLSESSVNTSNYGHENHLLKSKKRVSLCTVKKYHVEAAESIHKEKESYRRVTRQTKTFDSPTQSLSSPHQRLTSVSELSSDCNLTDVATPSPKRLKMDAHSIPKIANSPMEYPADNIVTNIDLENVKKLENAKRVLAKLHLSKPSQERAFIRKNLSITLKRPPEPELPVNPVTVQEPTNNDDYNTSNVREDFQTITETPLNIINTPTLEFKTNIDQCVNISWNIDQTERISDENNEDVGNPIFKTMLVNYIQEKKSQKRTPTTCTYIFAYNFVSVKMLKFCIVFF